MFVGLVANRACQKLLERLVMFREVYAVLARSRLNTAAILVWKAVV